MRKVDVPGPYGLGRHRAPTGAFRLVYLSAVCGAALHDLTGQDGIALMLTSSRCLGDPRRTISTRADMLDLRLPPQIGESDLENAATVGTARIGQILATAIGRLLVAGPGALPSRAVRAGDLTVTTPRLTPEA